ncbi:MAG: LPS export ABC transporter periplasmic protein LptC [Candidatus Omnitrophota bacterium]|nr:LPS export ABC transporter periplasmic protein LptC [Candidatus Omnitrophota bacterium]
MKHPIRRRLMYLGFQGLRGVGRVLPLGVARALGRGLGVLAYGLLGSQRRLTGEHLHQAFGETLSPAQRRRLGLRVFVNLGQTVMEWMALPACSTRRLHQLITCEGLVHLRQALARGRGAILVGAHFGNWELIPLYLRSRGFDGAVVARPLRYPEYDAFLMELRGSQGVTTLARGAMKDAVRLLRANHLLGIVPDQDVDSLDGLFVPFFGRPAYTPLGPAALSLLSGAPMLPCFIIREGRRFRLVIEPPVAAAQAPNRLEAMTELTASWSAVVESYVRRYPDHWVWMHRRWKTQPGSRQATCGDVSTQPTVQPDPSRAAFMMSGWLLVTSLIGCARPARPAASASEPTQQMSAFTLTGYELDGSKRWEMTGREASVDGNLVTIHWPDAVGYDLARVAYLTARVAEMDQTSRHVRMEHEVTIHTNDGWWLAAPVLHWIPDQNQVATETPVRIETDHMLLRGRGASALTQLKQAKLMEDVELVLNPGDQDPQAEGSAHVTITCDGPLSFDYEHSVATFERNVHVTDPQGELFSDVLIAYLDSARHTIRYAEAIGRVRVHHGHDRATGERAVYEPTPGKVTLIGKPRLLLFPSGGGPGLPGAFHGISAVPTASKPLQPAAAAPDAVGTLTPHATELASATHP